MILLIDNYDSFVCNLYQLIAGIRPDVIRDFLDKYEASVAYVNENVDAAAALVGQYDIVTEEVAKTALPECHIVCITGDEMKEKLSGYLSVLAEENAQSVGGTLPADDFYYSE